MANPLQKLAGFFKQAVQSGAESVVGIDVGSAYLKLVQLRRKAGRAVLETYGSLALGPYAGVEIGRATRLPPDTLAEALKDLVREAHVTTTRAAFAIPFSSSLVTLMTMPVLERKQLSGAVPIEARKHIPVPISEVSLDWWIIPKEPGAAVSPERASSGADDAARSGAPDAAPLETPQEFRVLIAAIHQDALARFEDIARRTGLLSSFFEIEVFSTVRALLPQDLEPHAILDLGAGATKLFIIDRGLLQFSHLINHGAQDLTLALSRAKGIGVSEAEQEKRKTGLLEGEPERISGEIRAGERSGVAASLLGLLNVVFAEAERALESFRARSGREVKDLILAGGGANLPGIAALAERASRLPVRRADPMREVEAPAFLAPVLAEVGPELAVALGVALRRLQETG